MMAERGNALGLAMLVGLVAAVAVSAAEQAQGGEERDTLSLTSLTNDYYSKPESLSSGYLSSGYPWDLVSEPERDMKIAVEEAAPDATFVWRFSEDANANAGNTNLNFVSSGTPTVWIDGEEEGVSAQSIPVGGKDTVVLKTTGQPVHMRSLYGHAGSAWILEVQELDGETEEVVREKRVQIVSKYVRREVRELAPKDRDRFLDALDIVYTISSEEGKAKYGSVWQNYKDFSLTHVGYKYQISCTPYHEGTEFFDAHQAFFYTLERSLQLIDPSIAVAYWDYIRDTQELGTEWYKSPAVALFGTPDSSGTLAGDERFSYVKIPTLDVDDADDDTVAWVTNVFGLVETPSSTNDSPYAQRFSEQGVCGITTQALPACPELMDTFSQTSLASFDSVLEASVHAPIHMILGGAVDCDTDLGELQSRFPALAEVWYTLSAWGYVYWQTAYMSGVTTLGGTCTSTSTFEECRWHSDQLEEALEDDVVTYSEGYSLLDTVWNSLSSYMEADPSDASGNSYRFPDVTDDENDELITAIAKYSVLPPRMGHLSTGNTADPLFPVAHIQYERFFHILKFNYENSDFNMTYVDDSSCYGRSWDDLTPFSNFLGDTSGKRYTNGDLWDMFEPHKVSVPYMFESLDLYCTTVDWEATDDSDDSGETEEATNVQAESLLRAADTVSESGSHSPSWVATTGAMLAVVPAAVVALVVAVRREYLARPGGYEQLS